MSPFVNSSAPLASNSEYTQARIQGPMIATCALAITACVLRFVARRMSKAGLWYDDWLIVPALVGAPEKLAMSQSLNWLVARRLRHVLLFGYLE